MKRRCILWLLLGAISLPSIAQNVIYSNLKELLTQDGDTVAVLRVEKRSRNQIVLSGGADYRITAGADESMCRLLKKRCFAVQEDTSLYINCKKLRYKRLRFGGWYAPAMWVNGNIFFSAIPIGVVAASSSVTMDVTLGGVVGDAIAASSLVSKRVYYEIDATTGKIDFVGRDRMCALLDSYPEWKEAYLNENSESAETTGKYLRLLKTAKK